MFITLHDKKEISVEGIYNKSCKPVFNMSKGKIYASGLATCDAIGAYPADLSRHLHGLTKTIKGQKFCFVSEVSDHIDEIAYIINAKQLMIDTQAGTICTLRETIHTQEETIAQLRTTIATYEAEQESKRKAKEEFEKRKAEYEAKRQALAEEARMLQELEDSLKEEI
jgi:chromosome segregation ATPase